jgi:hypothetical protein
MESMKHTKGADSNIFWTDISRTEETAGSHILFEEIE